MTKTIANINAQIIVNAIEKARPLTIAGRNALSNYRRFLSTKSMTACGLEASIVSLIKLNDPGLEGFISTLKGLMPSAKRKVAIAYESLISQPATTIFSYGTEAEQALAELYRYNAQQIIDKINDGVLAQYSMNPAIASLISYANAAKSDLEGSGLAKPNISTESIRHSMIPVINIASLGENGMLVSIDNMLLILGQRGSLSYAPNLSEMTGIPEDVQLLLTCMNAMKLDDSNVTLLSLKPEFLQIADKCFGIKEFKIDLMAGINEMVILNGNQMSVDKVKSIIDASKDSFIANIVTSEESSECLRMLNSIMDIFEKYRGVLISGLYSHKFELGQNALYIVKTSNAYSSMYVIEGNIVHSKKYDTVYQLLADENIIVSEELHNLVSMTFSSELKSEVNSTSIKHEILQKLIRERNEYAELLERIETSESELSQMEDANPEKAESLKSIRQKVSDSLKKVNEEIENASK